MTFIEEVAAECAAILDEQDDLTEGEKDEWFIRVCEQVGIANTPFESEENSATN